MAWREPLFTLECNLGKTSDVKKQIKERKKERTQLKVESVIYCKRKKIFRTLTAFST